MDERVEEDVRPYHVLRGTIESLGLQASEEIPRLIHLAWMAQQHRSEVSKTSGARPGTIVTRPAMTYATLESDPRVRQVFEEAGLNFGRFLTSTGLDTFNLEVASYGTERPPDIGIHELIKSGLQTFKNRFAEHRTVTAAALAYGMLADAPGPISEFRNRKLDVNSALAALTVLIGTPPSARVHRDRWTLNDALDYRLYARAITEFIRHPDTEAPFAICIQAPWGQGKTSLMRIIQQRLDPSHPDCSEVGADQEESKTSRGASADARLENPSIWFNAWTYQSSEAMWAGLAHAVISQLTGRLPKAERRRFWRRLQWRRLRSERVRTGTMNALLSTFVPGAPRLLLGLLVTALIGGVFWAGGSFFDNQNLAALLTKIGSVFSGASLIGALWLAIKGWVDARAQPFEKRLEGLVERYVHQLDYAGRMGFLHLIQEDLGRVFDLLVDPEHPPVVFVDDLDRCSPAKVGEVIEAINLFLAQSLPPSVFVLGLDAEVVAAAMEVVHEDVLKQLPRRKSELGWRFLDKFVQLAFVIPRLGEKQRESYLRHLLGIETLAPPRSAETQQQAEKLAAELAAGELTVDEATSRIRELSETASRGETASLQEYLIEVGASRFRDDDPNMRRELKELIGFLSDNPRTIKRVVNVYRFHRFVAWARATSALGLEAATPRQIAWWAVISVRWPQLVRWLQARVHGGGQGHQELESVLEALHRSESAAGWAKEIKEAEIRQARLDEDEALWLFLRQTVGSKEILLEAARAGLY